MSAEAEPKDPDLVGSVSGTLLIVLCFLPEYNFVLTIQDWNVPCVGAGGLEPPTAERDGHGWAAQPAAGVDQGAGRTASRRYHRQLRRRRRGS